MAAPVLTFPTLSGVQTLSASRFGLQSNTQIFDDQQLDAHMTNQLAGAKWVMHLQYDGLTQSDFSLIFAWLCSMSGQAGRVSIGPQHALSPRGVGTGTPTVFGATQTGSSLITHGWTINTNSILKAGDYFSFPTSRGQELHIVLADANSDGSGTSTLSIAPAIRTAPANGAAITVVNPSCIMQLKDDDQAMVTISPPLFGSFTIDLIEALN